MDNRGTGSAGSRRDGVEILKPGMTGYVKPPDQVRHKTGPAGAKVVVIWVPGEEGRRVASRWKREP